MVTLGGISAQKHSLKPLLHVIYDVSRICGLHLGLAHVDLVGFDSFGVVARHFAVTAERGSHTCEGCVKGAGSGNSNSRLGVELNNGITSSVPLTLFP